MTESISSTFARGEMRNRPLKILMAQIESLGEFVAVFRREYAKSQPTETAKHKLQKLVFNPEKQKLLDIFAELQKLAKDAFGIAAHAIIEQLVNSKMPPHQKKSVNRALL